VGQHWTRVVVSFFVLCSFCSLASAKRATNGRPAVRVVAKISFDANTPADMTAQRVRGRSYLLVQLAENQGVRVVDISKPKRPTIISRLTMAETGGQFEIKGDTALVGSGVLASSKLSSSDLVVWDVSDPRNPRIAQRFTDVLRVVQDENGYTYVLNREALWVVRDDGWAETSGDYSDDPSLYGGGG
jgi:uncharacterized secreted protein with C-terminal beta-propeller domain